jgi:hypothetical protein
MDSRESVRKPKNTEEIEEQDQEASDQTLEIDYEILRQKLQSSTQTTLNHLDLLIEASSKKTNKRLYLELFRALVVDSARSSESIFYLFEYVTDLRASMLLLSVEMQKAKGKTRKEVQIIKSKLDKLLNSPAMVEIGKVLQNIQKISEERNHHSEKKHAVEYLR